MSFLDTQATSHTKYTKTTYPFNRKMPLEKYQVIDKSNFRLCRICQRNQTIKSIRKYLRKNYSQCHPINLHQGARRRAQTQICFNPELSKHSPISNATKNSSRYCRCSQQESCCAASKYSINWSQSTLTVQETNIINSLWPNLNLLNKN